MWNTTPFLPLLLLFTPDVIAASQPPNIVLIVIDDLGKRLKILKVTDDLRTDTFAIIDDLGKGCPSLPIMQFFNLVQKGGGLVVVKPMSKSTDL